MRIWRVFSMITIWSTTVLCHVIAFTQRVLLCWVMLISRCWTIVTPCLIYEVSHNSCDYFLGSSVVDFNSLAGQCSRCFLTEWFSTGLFVQAPRTYIRFYIVYEIFFLIYARLMHVFHMKDFPHGNIILCLLWIMFSSRNFHSISFNQIN